MGTTSADLAAHVLDELERIEPFVVLHGEAELGAGRATSDVDVAVGRNPQAIVAQLSDVLAARGVAPIMLWPYDRNSLTVFWSDTSGDEGVQLDLVDDPAGRGRYGFRTDVLIARGERGSRWPRLDAQDELLYLIRKRQVKRNEGEVVRLLHSMATDAAEPMINRAHEAFSEPAASQLEAMLTTGGYVDPKGAAFDRRVRNIVANPGFYGSRLTRSVGAWVSVGGATVDEIEDAVAPLRELLPSVVVRQSLRTRAEARVHTTRARLLVTSDPDGVDPRADVGVDGGLERGELRSAIVGGLADRLRHRGSDR